jgi:hypothetical protein
LQRIEKSNAAKNPSRERKRAVSIALATLPLSVRIPRANIAARSEALGCGRQVGIGAPDLLLFADRVLCRNDFIFFEIA